MGRLIKLLNEFAGVLVTIVIAFAGILCAPILEKYFDKTQQVLLLCTLVLLGFILDLIRQHARRFDLQQGSIGMLRKSTEELTTDLNKTP